MCCILLKTFRNREIDRAMRSTLLRRETEHAMKLKANTPTPDTKTNECGNREVDELSTVDHVVTSAKPSLLKIFEDTDAAIKMIIRGRSPTMRHVSRTLRVALDWLFDRINLDPQIQIISADTKNQLADLLTKGNFTHDEWNHLLRLFNIVSFSVFSCSHFKSVDKSKIMSKGQQEGRPGEEERVVAKPKPMMSLGSKIANRSPTLDWGVSKKPGDSRNAMSEFRSFWHLGNQSREV